MVRLSEAVIIKFDWFTYYYGVSLVSITRSVHGKFNCIAVNFEITLGGKSLRSTQVTVVQSTKETGNIYVIKISFTFYILTITAIVSLLEYLRRSK